MDIELLKFLALARDEAERIFLTILKEDSEIADNMRNVWKHQSSGAD